MRDPREILAEGEAVAREKAVREALYLAEGEAGLAAKTLGVSSATFHRWLGELPAVQAWRAEQWPSRRGRRVDGAGRPIRSPRKKKSPP